VPVASASSNLAPERSRRAQTSPPRAEGAAADADPRSARGKCTVRAAALSGTENVVLQPPGARVACRASAPSWRSGPSFEEEAGAVRRRNPPGSDAKETDVPLQDSLPLHQPGNARGGAAPGRNITRRTATPPPRSRAHTSSARGGSPGRIVIVPASSPAGASARRTLGRNPRGDHTTRPFPPVTRPES